MFSFVSDTHGHRSSWVSSSEHWQTTGDLQLTRVPEVTLCTHEWSSANVLFTKRRHWKWHEAIKRTAAVNAVSRHKFKGNNTIKVSKMLVWTKSCTWLQRNYFVKALFGRLNHWSQSLLYVFFVIWNKSSRQANCSGLPKVEQRRAMAALKSNCAIFFSQLHRGILQKA